MKLTAISLFETTRNLKEVYHNTKWVKRSTGEALLAEYVLGVEENVALIEPVEYEDGTYFFVWIYNHLDIGKQPRQHLPLEYPTRRGARTAAVKTLLHLHSNEASWLRFFNGDNTLRRHYHE